MPLDALRLFRKSRDSRWSRFFRWRLASAPTRRCSRCSIRSCCGLFRSSVRKKPVRQTAGGFQYGNAWGDGDELSYPMYQDLHDANDVFSGMFCRHAPSLDVSINGAGERVQAELVSGGYFSILGVVPAAGRVLGASDEQAPGAHPLVVLSHRYWQKRFRSDARDRSAATIRINGRPPHHRRRRARGLRRHQSRDRRPTSSCRSRWPTTSPSSPTAWSTGARAGSTCSAA